MTKPGSESAIVAAILGIALAGAVLGYGIGRQDTARSTAPATATVSLSLPPSPVIHPPMICRQGVCGELKAGAP